MRYLSLAALALAAVSALALAEAPLETIEQEGLERNTEGRAAQERIDAVHRKSLSLIDDYRAELKLVEGLQTYITMLDEQLVSQQKEVATLQESIGEVAVVERQVLPLMARMVDSLASFIELDVPFLLEERRARAAKLRELLKRSDVTVAEKARRVFEAYQIESDFGRTLEAYKAKLVLDDASFDADFLRVGRIGLMYRTVGADKLGFWDPVSEDWRDLAGVPYRRFIEKGLKVARQEIAPELVSIPLNLEQVDTP